MNIKTNSDKEPHKNVTLPTSANLILRQNVFHFQSRDESSTFSFKGKPKAKAKKPQTAAEEDDDDDEGYDGNQDNGNAEDYDERCRI